MAKKRDPGRGKRQLKTDFSSEEALQRFKDFCDENGLSYSHLMEAGAEYIIAAILSGDIDLTEYLLRSKLPWLRTYDIDLDKLREDLRKKYGG